MDLKTAENLKALLTKSKAETWTVRRPTPEMIAHFGEQGLHPFIEQPRAAGEAVGKEVLAEDYSGNDELREAHIAIIIEATKHLRELVDFWLEKNGLDDVHYPEAVRLANDLAELE
jgi:hypothetical protein